jgi:putative ABC transport system permease protein
LVDQGHNGIVFDNCPSKQYLNIFGRYCGGERMGSLLQDLRHGARLLLKSPVFTVVAVLTLALGIGANTAFFSVVNAVLVKPLPYPEPDRLVTFWISAPAEGMRDMEWTEGLFAFLRDHNQTFESMAAYDGTGFNMTSRGEPERLNGTTVTSDFFRVLGQEPVQGRTFFPQEDTPGNNNVIILSYELWQRRFGGDVEILGKPLNLNNVPTVVVGIMPPGFDFPNHTEVWVPVGLDSQDNSLWYIDPIGKLKPGVTVEDGQREIVALIDDFARQQNWPKAETGTTILARPLAYEIVGEVRTPLLVLLCAAGLVLLIACANIANLLLVRAGSRSREIAVRCCLGASPRRIARQLLTESLLLAAMGAVCGLFLAFWGVKALKALSLEAVPRIENVQVDTTVLLFTFGVALLAGLLFGLAPALWASRVNLNEAMKEGARGSSASSRRVNNAFVILQFALSLVLLVGAGLLLQSFKNLLSVDPGFRPENALVGRLELPDNKYTDKTQIRSFYNQLTERVENLPGVRAAGLSQMVPFGKGGDGNPFTVEGPEPAPDETLPEAWWRSVTPGYFEAMGIPILNGRSFKDSDTQTTPLVAIVDEKLARNFWPGEDPIGKRIRIGRASWGNPLMTVVGVVTVVKHRNLDENSKYYIYMPASQEPQSTMYLVIRTANEPEAMVSAVRSQISALDPELPLFEIHTMEQAVDSSLAAKRWTNLLLAGFAVTALLLAAVGIYGVMSLNVSSRINEFGIRLALGAQSGDLIRLVLGQAAALVATGLAVGLLVTLWITPLLASLLYGVSETDPLTFALVSLALVIVALMACYIPARRATKVDPIIALRCE